MNDKSINLQAMLSQAAELLQKARRYSLVLFIGFVVAIYGFILLRIHSLGSSLPSNTVINSQDKGSQVPHIDETVLKQLKNLQDNSVSVHTLFDQARNNPFQ